MRSFKQHDLNDGSIAHWLQDVRSFASYNPESVFAVGCVLRASYDGHDDLYFAGANVENAEDHRLGAHGEESAISAMVTALGKQAVIKELWVIGAPNDTEFGTDEFFANNMVACCGKCKQQIAGFIEEEAPIHYVNLNNEIVKTTNMKEGLVDIFSFRNYIPELVDPKQPVKSYSFETASNRIMRKAKQTQPELRKWMKDLEGVDYVSGKTSPVILELTNGAYVAGVNIEEAAFVSINAAQAAVSIARTEFKDFEIAKVYTLSDPPDRPLSLASIQTLSNFMQDQNEMEIINLRTTRAQKMTFQNKFTPSA